MEFKLLKTYCDGGSRGNPGPAAYGVVIKDEHGKVIVSASEYIGITTNNQAEYRGLIRALELAKELGAKEVQCYMDSELIVKQMRREYKVKEPTLQKMFILAWNLAVSFSKVSYHHIRRELNTEADEQVNIALDEQALKRHS